MATLVLMAAGSAIGGTMGAVGAAVGGAIGAMAGRSVDALIFRPGARSGPRLSDLQVQTSRYGAPIARLHGKIRVAGTVIWATDLKESKATRGGGKGQPSLTSYSYSASLAVALSSRVIVGVGRIWADGNLLRGAAGDFKSPLGAFRLHLGRANQEVDPLIASAVGLGAAPAYRGCAYAVFEDLQLTDFGNRIPSLTFEVIADTGSVSLQSIGADLSGRPVEFYGATASPTVEGFAAEGPFQGAMDDLVGLNDLLWHEAEGALHLTSGLAADHLLDPTDGVRAVDGRTGAPLRHRRTPIESVPSRLAIRYHDPERDYQVGVQAASRPGPGASSDEVDLPAVIAASDARELADRKLRTALRRRSRIETTATWAALLLKRGDVITLVGEQGLWLVETSEWDDMAVRLSLRAFESGPKQIAQAGGAGEPVRQPDVRQSETSLAIVELPGDGTSASTSPILMVAACGVDSGWRRAALFRYDAAPEMAGPIGSTAPRAVMGASGGLLPAADPWRLDLCNHVEIQLDDPSDVLTGVADELLMSGANLCMIGEEVLQFGHAEWVSPGCYRLSRLLRGRYGTEWAMLTHIHSERFVLLEADKLAPVTVTAGDVGTVLTVRAIGRGDADPVEVQRLIDGRAMMPPSPVHGRAVTRADGDIAISWVRRSRLGWAWIDGADAPLAEEQEAYVLTIMAGERNVRQWDVGGATAIYSEADLLNDMASAAPAKLHIEIRQRGNWGLSRALVVPIP